jgi:hypothetical protein
MTFKTFQQLKEPTLAQNLEMIERSLAGLRALKRGEVRAFDGEKITPKVCWKIECYLQGLIYRTVALCEGGKTCWNASNLLGAVILARSVLENAALAFRFYDGIRLGVRAADFSVIDGEVTKLTLATRHHSLIDNLPEAPNILASIDKLDKHYSEERADKSVRRVYDFLCEFAHPNYVGTVGLFGKLDRTAYIKYFSEENTIADRVAWYVAMGLGSVSVVHWCCKDVMGLLPEVAKISEADRNKGAP